MTLCLAWKQGREVYFASDSRLTDGNNSILTNHATKIFRIGVEIYGPTGSDTPNVGEQVLYQSSLGFCFTGSYLNGSLLADTISEVLSNLQGTPEYSDFSINNLVEIAFVIYKQISRQLSEIHREKGLSEALFGGYCPITNNFHLYKFSPKHIPDEQLDFEKVELNIDEGTIFIGDSKAKKRAEELLEKINRDYSHFHLLREIIKDPNIITVGGNIQAGLFRPCKFKTYGIAEYEIVKDDSEMLQVKDSYKFRGFSLSFNDTELRRGNINIMKTFFNPFEKERIEYFDQVIQSIDKQLEKKLNQDNGKPHP